MGLRRQAREYALRSLYLTDVAGVDPKEALKAVTDGTKFNPQGITFMETLVFGITENKKRINELINKYTENWELSRIANVDRNVLRIGIYEIIKMPETPIKVIIDEAVEIAKKFSSEQASKFVNGILDKIKVERTENNES